jgi:hypothetical protein
MFSLPKVIKKKIQDNLLNSIFYSILALTVVMLALYAVASTLAASTLIGQIGLIISVFALVATTIVKRILNIKNNLEIMPWGSKKIPLLLRTGLISNLLGDLLLVTTGVLNGINLLINITGGTPLNIFFFSAPFSNYIIPGIFLLYLVTAIFDAFAKYKMYAMASKLQNTYYVPSEDSNDRSEIVEITDDALPQQVVIPEKKTLNQALVKLIFSFTISILALLSCPAISSVIFGNISLSWLFGAAVAGSTLTPIFILGPLLIALTIAAIIYAAISNKTLGKDLAIATSQQQSCSLATSSSTPTGTSSETNNYPTDAPPSPELFALPQELNLLKHNPQSSNIEFSQITNLDGTITAIFKIPQTLNSTNSSNSRPDTYIWTVNENKVRGQTGSKMECLCNKNDTLRVTVHPTGSRQQSQLEKTVTIKQCADPPPSPSNNAQQPLTFTD